MMNLRNISHSSFGLAMLSLLATGPVFAEEGGSLEDAITGGKLIADFNLRLETVDQDNALKDAEALTLRSILGWQTGAWHGFSVTAAFHDSRPVFGVSDYSVPPSGYKTGEYSVIADPKTTELDQAWLQYAAGGFSARVGRQVINLDDQRFVGAVGWRQDRQTFDAAQVKWAPVETVELLYAYLDQRNRIFAEDADIDSADHLLNASWKTPVGTLTGFGYLLENENAVGDGPDSWGLRFAGKRDLDGFDLLYAASWATQSADAGPVSVDADYLFFEAGAAFEPITVKAGYEVLGSDDGLYGFATPLATLHKFNGWTDQFLSTPPEGLRDLYASLGGKLLGGGWTVVWHDFEADDPSPATDDIGSELGMVYTRKFADHFTAGLKYARFDAGATAGGKVDTDKLWAWVSASF